ncbi:deleted in malignant brain tumors 1 protein-like isoform X2 [Haliotis asinina]|uniref:deleted in malignant brain tumors 1 protein-like isoform X2 n=1 Tax=Haliotis asinina TaxID=109174 RepID=UPI003531C822
MWDHLKQLFAVLTIAWLFPSTSSQTTGNIRLVDGARLGEGRLEVCYNERWGGVCDDDFTINAASVTCRQLGYSPRNATFSSVSWPVDFLLDDVNCTGQEAALQDCVHNAWGTHDCGTTEHLHVACYSSCTDHAPGDIRLVDGAWSGEGRLEVCYSGRWGGVCDDEFTANAAAVACGQLGYSPLNATFSSVTWPVDFLLDDVRCTGQETELQDCVHSAWDTHNCGTNEHLHVACSSTVHTTGDIRLVDGAWSGEGRLEVFYSGRWGGVCDDDFTANAAAVACRQLGYSPLNATFSSVTWPVDFLLDDVKCTGQEAALQDCVHNAWGTHNCQTTEHLHVACSRQCTDHTTGNIRLVDGARLGEGRLEVCYNAGWGGVCDDEFNANAAAVACRQLGYSPLNATFSSVTWPVDFLLDDVSCTGQEAALQDCVHSAWGTHDCESTEHLRVACYMQATCTDYAPGDIRLVDGARSWEGRLEVCYNERWGGVCDDAFTANAAAVACRQLGYPHLDATFSSVTWPVDFLLDDVKCTGQEAALQDCVHSAWGTHNCGTTEHLHVACFSPCTDHTPGDIRLVDGSGSGEGRLEVCYNEKWGGVCDHEFNANAAAVTCRQLGYSPLNVTFSSVTWPVDFLLDDVNCTGQEAALQDCVHNAWGTHNCQTTEHLHVSCFSPCTDHTPGDIQLVDGAWSGEGRLEVCYNGIWGGVCDDDFTANAAAVTCRQLGYSPHNATVSSVTWSVDFLLDDVNCTGQEAALQDCVHRAWGTHNCGTTEHLHVACFSPCTDHTPGDIRLVDGSGSGEGRLEVCYNGIWGGVCDNDFTANAAAVTCRQLGYSPHNATFSSVTWSVDFLLDDVNCTGQEAALQDCVHSAWGTHNCGTTEHLHVACFSPCTDHTPGDIQLVDGAWSGEGRLEVCYNGIWGGVCDDDFTANAAAVTCRQLGYSSHNATFSSVTWSVDFLLDDVNCTGQEAALQDCVHSAWGTHNCGTTEHLHVACFSPCTDHTPGDIRLVGGARSGEGRLEVCYNERWGGVCDDDFTANAAAVACGQLGYSPLNATFSSVTWPVDFLMDDIKCTGQEAALQDCVHRAWGDHNCGTTDHLHVACSIPCTNNVCRNGGTCMEIPHTHAVICSCPTGFQGVYCEQAQGLQITCTSQNMFVEFDKKEFPSLHADSLTLRDPTCGATDTLTKITLTAPLGGCGTHMEVVGDDFVYVNEITAQDVTVSGHISHVRDVNVTVRCFYNRNVVASNYYLVDNGDLDVLTSSKGKYDISMNLIYKGVTYQPSSSTPLSVKPGEDLSIKLSLQSNDSNLQIFARNCKATPTPSPNSSVQYLILENGCAHDSTLTFTNVSDVTKETLTLETFKFVNSSSMVYFHCEVLVCNASDPKSRCQHGCLTPSKQKRDAGESGESDFGQEAHLTSQQLSAGPIRIANKRSKRSPKFDDDKDGNVYVYGDPALIVGVALMCMSLVMVMATLHLLLRGNAGYDNHDCTENHRNKN